MTAERTTRLRDCHAVDSSGNVIVTGLSWNDGYDDYVTIKYSF